MFIILLGTPSVGKNFVGEILSQKFDFYYYDADELITKEMKHLIRKGKILNQEMRIKWVKSIVVPKLKIPERKHERLIVSQALVNNSVQKLMKKEFPKAKFILIKADKKSILRRAKGRNHLINKDYVEKIIRIFEYPKIEHFIINNENGKETLIKQFGEILKQIN